MDRGKEGGSGCRRTKWRRRAGVDEEQEYAKSRGRRSFSLRRHERSPDNEST